LLQQVAEQIKGWPPSLERKNLAIDLTRFYLQLDDLFAAERWWREAGVHADQPLAVHTSEAWSTLIWLRLAQHRGGKADLPVADLLRLMDDLRQRQAPLLAHQLEFALLEALIHDAAGDGEAARVALLRAVELAEPQRHVRFFLEGGEPVRQMLLSIGNANVAKHFQDYVVALIKAFPPHAEEDPQAAQVAILPTTEETAPVLLDPLTEREIETLRLLATGLSIPEIADELVVTVSTVRSYCKRVYSKLDAHSRIEAVAHAQQMKLL
jgi:LuxR family transcriptional regulator, maltose regulon positive regulatory protein